MTDGTAALDRRRRQTSVSFALALLLAAIVINVGTVLLVRGHSTVAGIDSDEQEYWSLASGLLNDGISSIPARRTVPFPLILASLRAILGDSYLAVQLALSAVLALVPFVAYLLVRAHFG